MLDVFEYLRIFKLFKCRLNWCLSVVSKSLTPSASESCCKGASSQDCWTIDVAQDDSHYSNHSVTCLDFVRSTGACFPSSSASTHREQFNAITAFIDASMVYGSDNETFHYLRTGYQNGQLAENSNHSGFLPWESEVKPNGSPSNVIAGDIRANEMPGLTVMHSRKKNMTLGSASNL